MTSAASGKNYSLTGSREKELESLVGQKVEIVGTLDNAKGNSPGATTGYGSGSTATGTTTGAAGTTGAAAGTTGAAAGTTASASGANDLATLNIVSFRAVGGSCTPQ